MWVAIVVILVGVYVVATGRGGELAYEYADHAPLDLGPVSAADVALLRPPTALWGYNMQVTDEALDRIAQAIRDRDLTIAHLQLRLAALEPRSAPSPAGWPEPGIAATRQEPAWPGPGWYETPPRTAEWPQAGQDPGPEVPGPEVSVSEVSEVSVSEVSEVSVSEVSVSEVSVSAADQAAASPGDADPPASPASRDDGAFAAEEQDR